jgi:hypothetical protein
MATGEDQPKYVVGDGQPGEPEIACLSWFSRVRAAVLDMTLEKNRQRVSNYQLPARLGSDGAVVPLRKEPS